MEASATTPVADKSDNWFRNLKADRLEVCIKDEASGLRLRASGPQDDIWKLVERFEELSGIAVDGEWRRPPRTGSRPLAGQLTLGEEPGGGE